jgi:drug/metabolite transporter (DMT)-like permease
VSLAIGQTLQLYALQTASVAIVAFIGSVDILFTTLFAALLMGDKNIRSLRFLLAILLVLAGSAFLL